MKEFVRSREYGIHAMCAYLNSWSDRLAANQNCMVLSYENLHADTAATLERLLNYLDIPVDTENLRMAIESSSFAAMKKIEKESTIPGTNFNFSRDDEDCARVRKGKVGGYTDYLDDADIAYIRVVCENELTEESKRLLSLHLP